MVAGSLFSSCVDEVIPQQEEVDDPMASVNGYALTFKINLNTMTRVGSSSDFEKYEDYIDPSSLRVLFFYGDEENPAYNTLIRQFTSDEINLIPTNNNGNSFSKEWYISIPFKETDEEFCNIIRDNVFKIAIAANWPNLSIKPGDNIQKLHHQPVPEEQGDDAYLESDTYRFLFERETTLGTYTNWVKSSYTTKNPKEWIMTHYGPGVNVNEEYNPKDTYGQLKYDELWQRWNFSDAYYFLPEHPADQAKINPQITYRDENYSYNPKLGNNEFAEDWAEKNYRDLYDMFWEEKEIMEENTLKKIDVKITKNSELNDFGDLETGGYFQFIQNTDNNRPKAYIHEEDDTTVGIVLPEGNKDKNVIRIKIPNNGELNIKWASFDGGTSRLKLEMRNHLDDSTGKDKSIQDANNSNNYNFAETTSKSPVSFTSKEIKITGDAEYLFIYAEEKPVIIYEIEYISSYYLKNIDNVGKSLGNPDDTHLLIPMYGVQTFIAIGNLWKPGTVFDLSNFNKLDTETNTSNNPPTTDLIYPFKSISLLRSVAKVELKIPKIYKAHHIFLRSINRRSRCEPVDVSTPTDKIWEKTNGNVGPNDQHGDICKEWDNIYGHEPFFDLNFRETKDEETGITTHTQLNEYQEKLAWYYGTWGDGDMMNGIPIKKTPDKDYPHIMNAMIGRTDFTEFIEAGSDSYYDRYVLYVPDKYVDDPGSVGSSMITTAPKICHIEFREENDPYTNIDDNWCYRIYFTDGGFNKEMKYPDFSKYDDNSSKTHDWETDYEKNVNNLQKHWPIIRNHYYRFTVVDARNRMVVTKLEVLPWRMIEDNSYSW